MTAFTNHFSFEFRTGIRNRTLLMMNYLFPLGFYLLLGFVMPEINPLFLETMIPAMVVFAILAATLLGLPDPLVTAREAGIFRSFKINEVPSTSILSVPAMTTSLHLVIVTVIITFSAPLLFDAPLPVNWSGYVLTFIVTTFACAGIGVLIGVISSSTRSTVLWSQLIFLPSMLLGGLMLPYGMLPDAVQKVAQLLPTTHAMNAFNGLAMGNASDLSPWMSIIILFFGGILAFGLAIYLFSWDSQNTTRRGNLLLALLAWLPYVVGLVLTTILII
jgi:ABC-2 type transport system permease protein